MLMGIWMVTGSIRLQNLAVRSTCAFNCTPSGNKLVGIHNSMGTEFASKFNSMLPVVVKFQLFKLVQGMLSITGPINTQKDGVQLKARPFLTPQPGSGVRSFQQPSRSAPAPSVPALWWRRPRPALLSQCLSSSLINEGDFPPPTQLFFSFSVLFFWKHLPLVHTWGQTP
eukprot:1160913-Pelagomonas_calceolata.AAC.6